MSETDIIYAPFQPSDTRLLTGSNNNQLLVDNPILSSILAKIFPYLLIADNALEIITWTNEDPYTNFLFIIIYSIVIMYWNSISLVILPIIMALVFSYMIWIVNSTIFDIKYNEKPTIDEILHTLHNITVRFEMLLKPIKKSDFKAHNFIQMFVMTVLLTPVHLLLINYALSPKKFLWLTGLFVLSYHSPWSYSLRRLLWRSVYVRILVFYLTGLDIKLNMESKSKPINSKSMEHALSDLKVLNKSVESPTRLKQTILFEVLENERRWIGIGWSKLLLPSERSNYCFPHTLIQTVELSQFSPPVFNDDLYSYSWEWLDQKWSIDKEFSKNKNNGWKFFDNSWENGDFIDGFSKFTRSRMWTRRAVLCIDKRTKVNDK
ncbi:hypothetical protein CANTEDRAFT_116361 [Yamadazyma tenuis ATCC 10573]|uniref:Integral peroxisomal membrane peroxin n=1 Tax=Candida tenuis (strain ATCC 10573 / BCRC 21748 / CBS 615 / JCM 9827 / NBRC 10315 / NRRL Y-1498 / VKM Y-70) TaxID=590646 RepID=G3BDJ0_CANTC|nr:integral peroxisomal membrane peroxin [Yamadazyma tenuis ATCC 10573]XP_006690302.1 uncharacterized protein CANTEDRAFT_116361 [Yamadazyma tenuis ATCC 10573]EGV61087.1 integral peroxisomal membrane peroxin [Yamadazyma tenuis ATCC 10573]EGV61088.1 hypothetical protein CANTEDRAFT_116361 [Yamadazyma tenuis ATCC 10573]